MKTWKLVAGILSIILFAVVTMQSCAVGVVNTLEDNGGNSGSLGIVVAILLLTGGIVSIAIRNSVKKGGNIALVILYGIASIIGFTGYGNYGDLLLWSVWCMINMILALVSIVKSGKNIDIIAE